MEITKNHYQEFIQLDLQLQNVLSVGLENNLLSKMLSLSTDHSLRIRSFTESSTDGNLLSVIKTINNEHLGIIDVVLTGKPKNAEDRILKHLNNAENRTLSALKNMTR